MYAKARLRTPLLPGVAEKRDRSAKKPGWGRDAKGELLQIPTIKHLPNGTVLLEYPEADPPARRLSNGRLLSQIIDLNRRYLTEMGGEHERRRQFIQEAYELHHALSSDRAEREVFLAGIAADGFKLKRQGDLLLAVFQRCFGDAKKLGKNGSFWMRAAAYLGHLKTPVSEASSVLKQHGLIKCAAEGGRLLREKSESPKKAAVKNVSSGVGVSGKSDAAGSSSEPAKRDSKTPTLPGSTTAKVVLAFDGSGFALWTNSPGEEFDLTIRRTAIGAESVFVVLSIKLSD